MIALFTENENNAKPPERDSEPSGDGTPERSPTPRGSSANQSELVSDGAEAFEEQQTGVAVSYELKEHEIYQCLKREEISRTKGVHFISAGMLLIAAVLCILSGIATKNTMQYIFAVCWLGLAATFLVWPLRNLRTIAKNSASGSKVHLKIYPDHIEAESSKNQMEIPLDGTSECARVQDTIALFLPNKDQSDTRIPRLLILPLRCIDEGVLPDVEAMILAGTRPKKMRG